MARRRKWPEAVETAVLTQSRRRCCLCFGLNNDSAVRRGQVAHVDHDRSNMALENAAYLCFDHHDEYDSPTSQSKGITAAELTAHRERLYRAIEEGALPDDDEPPRTLKLHSARNTTTGDNSPIINAGRDVNFNPRITRRNVIQLGPEHLSADQARGVQERIDDLVELDPDSDRERKYKRWWGKVKTQFRVPTYREIPSARYDEVTAWLQRQAALLRPKLRRSNKAAWRNSLYTGIWARAREVGMSKEDVHEFAGTVLGLEAAPESLKDLGEMNLKRVYDAFFRHTRG